MSWTEITNREIELMSNRFSRTINLTKHQEKEVNEELRDVWKIFGNGKPDWKHGSIPELLKGLESAAPV